MVKLIKYWWQGKYISPSERDGGTGMLLIGVYKRHWTSEAIHQLVKFWLINWKVLLPIIIAAFVALFIHFDSKATGKAKQKTNKQGDVNVISVKI